MTNRESRIKRYQERAKECMRIADAVSDPSLRGQYTHVAESYLKLAEVEVRNLSGNARKADQH